MNRTFKNRLDRLERAQEGREPLDPWLVVTKGLNGVYGVDGKHYATLEEAKAAHPNRCGGVVVLEEKDCRIPPKEVPDAA